MRGGFSVSRYIEQSRHDQYRADHPEYVAELEQTRQRIEAREREQDASNLPALQQAALLMMTVSRVKNAVIARLLEDAQDKPSGADFRTLRDKGLAEYKVGKRQHDLTPAGIIAAKKLQQALCIRFDIHVFFEGARVGWQAKFHCTCGKDYLVRSSPTAYGNAHRQWRAEHVTQEGMTKLVEALKPPVRMEG